MNLPALGLALLALLPSGASADVLTLRHGARLEGIVVDRTPDTIAVRVSEAGFAYLDPATVVSVEAQDGDAHRRLLSRWKREALSQAEKEEVLARFTKSQKAKGLTEVRGEWLTAKELDRRLELERLEVEKARLARPLPPTQIIVTIQAPAPAAQTVAFFPARRPAREAPPARRSGRTFTPLPVPHPWSFDWDPSFTYAFMTPRF